MHHDLHIAALGNEFNVAGIQALRLSGLRDVHAVVAAGLVAAELEAAAHRLRLSVQGEQQGAAAVLNRQPGAARDRPGGVPADGIAAVDRHIDRCIGGDGGQIHAHRAGHRRPAHHAALRPGRWNRQKRKQRKQQRGKPFCLYHGHVPLSSLMVSFCMQDTKAIALYHNPSPFVNAHGLSMPVIPCPS